MVFPLGKKTIFLPMNDGWHFDIKFRRVFRQQPVLRLFSVQLSVWQLQIHVISKVEMRFVIRVTSLVSKQRPTLTLTNLQNSEHCVITRCCLAVSWSNIVRNVGWKYQLLFRGKVFVSLYGRWHRIRYLHALQVISSSREYVDHISHCLYTCLKQASSVISHNAGWFVRLSGRVITSAVTLLTDVVCNLREASSMFC